MISSLRTVKFTELSDKLSIQSILRPLDNKFVLEKIRNFLWPDAVTCGLWDWIPSGYWPFNADCITVPDWCFECHLHPDMSLSWWCTAVWSQLICKHKRPMWATVAHLSTMNASNIWHQNGTKTSGLKGHITCTWVQCATFLKDQPGWPFLFTDWQNANLVEDVEILIPVNFRWIPFSGFGGNVE